MTKLDGGRVVKIELEKQTCVQNERNAGMGRIVPVKNDRMLLTDVKRMDLKRVCLQQSFIESLRQ